MLMRKIKKKENSKNNKKTNKESLLTKLNNTIKKQRLNAKN